MEEGEKTWCWLVVKMHSVWAALKLQRTSGRRRRTHVQHQYFYSSKSCTVWQRTSGRRQTLVQPQCLFLLPLLLCCSSAVYLLYIFTNEHNLLLWSSPFLGSRTTHVTRGAGTRCNDRRWWCFRRYLRYSTDWQNSMYTNPKRFLETCVINCVYFQGKLFYSTSFKSKDACQVTLRLLTCKRLSRHYEFGICSLSQYTVYVRALVHGGIRILAVRARLNFIMR